MLLLTILLWCLLVTAVRNVEKTWRYSNDLSNPANWIDGKAESDCKGTIFPVKLGSVASVNEWSTEEITLPYDGEIEIREGGFIEFAQDSLCIRIKELEHRSWLDPNSWTSGQNRAVPHVERVPCARDDVAFPENATVAVYSPPVSVVVNSVQIGGVHVPDDQWQDFLESDYGGEQFYKTDYQSKISIKPARCVDKSGCSCHDSEDLLDWVCEFVKDKSRPVACLDPVSPVGHCTNICGGVIILNVVDRFNLEEFKKELARYREEVEIHVSKVIRHKKAYIQIVVTDKETYNEYSAKIAKTIYKSILNDMEGFKVKSTSLQISGIGIPKGSRWMVAISIIFGTLLAVLIVSAIFYSLYVGPFTNFGFRIRLGEVSFRSLRPFSFRKFHNGDEGRVSLAASMMSLAKSFDNPMYGTNEASTSGGIIEIPDEARPRQSQSIHENIVFDTEMPLSDEDEDELEG